MMMMMPFFFFFFIQLGLSDVVIVPVPYLMLSTTAGSEPNAIP